MKIFKKIIYSIAIIVLFISCDNSLEDLNITIDESGSLTYEIIDIEGEKVDSAKLYLYDPTVFEFDNIMTNGYKEYAIKSIYTNDNGVADFGKLNNGLYLVYAVIKTKANNDFTISNFVQIVSGEKEIRTIDLSEYIGSLKFSIYSYNESNASSSVVDSLNIALIPASDYYSNNSFEQHMNNAIPIGKTDSLGIISATKIPVGTYCVIAYYDNENYDILSTKNYPSSDYITINKEATSILVLYADLEVETPVQPSDEYKYKVYYTEYNEATEEYDTTYLNNAYILFSSANYSTFDRAYSNQEKVLTTDENGYALLTDIENLYYSSYYLWVYTDISTFQEFGYRSMSSMRNQTTTFEVKKETFFKVYGSFEMNGKAKYESGTSYDTLSLKNVSILLTTSSTTSFSNILRTYTTKTDSLGYAKLDKIAVGEYFLWAYSDEDHAQRAYFKVKIEEGKTSTVEPVFDADEVMILYGNLNFQFYTSSSSSSEPVKNAFVILTKYNKNNVSSALSEAIATGKTDENGQATIEHLEVNTSYYVMVYYDYEHYYTDYTSYTVSSDPNIVFKITNTDL